MLRMNQSAEAVPAICTEHLIFLHSPSSLLPLSVEASPIIPGRIDETGRNEATRNTECSPPEDSIVSVRTDICLRLLNIHDSDSLLNLQEAEALQYSGRFSLDETNESSTGSPISSGPSSTCWIPASSKFEAASSRSRDFGMSHETSAASAASAGNLTATPIPYSSKDSDDEVGSTEFGTGDSRQQSWQSEESTESVYNTLDAHTKGTCKPCRARSLSLSLFLLGQVPLGWARLKAFSSSTSHAILGLALLQGQHGCSRLLLSKMSRKHLHCILARIVDPL